MLLNAVQRLSSERIEIPWEVATAREHGGSRLSLRRGLELEPADQQRVVGNFTVDNKNESTREGNLQRL